MSLRHQLLYDLRSSGRIPSPMIMKRYHTPQRIMRPIKLSVMPSFMLKAHQQMIHQKPTIATPLMIHFQSSPPGPNSGEYVFENPFSSVSLPPVYKLLNV